MFNPKYYKPSPNRKNKIHPWVKFRCPNCFNRTTIYEEVDIGQTRFYDLEGNVKQETIICRACKQPYEISKRNLVQSNLSLIREKRKQKMEIPDMEIGGQYLVPDDIGTKGDKAILKIVKQEDENENIRIEETEFGERKSMRILIPVELSEGQIKTFSAAPTNAMTLKKLFGKESDDWYGKEFEVLLESCGVAKSGLQITVLDKDLSKKK